MKKVITYGTFDLFHQGHYNIIKHARELGDYLIVGVTSESYDIERGKLNVRDSLAQRMENVRKTGLADEIIVEEYQGQKLNDIIKYNVDILALGSDWRGKFDYLNKYCEVRYRQRTKNISSTMLRSAGTIYRVGIVTEDGEDHGIVWESKHVSGIHVDSVFSRDEETARSFCEKYELNSYWNDYDRFLEQADIVYVKCPAPEKLEYVDRAVREGKYVISDSPISEDSGVLRELFHRAEERRVVLVEKIMPVYLRAFNQLVWLIHCNLIGRVISVKCSISRDVFGGGNSFDETVVHGVCAVMKIMGQSCGDVSCNAVSDDRGEPVYKVITMKYPRALATIEIGSGLDVESGLTILGDGGRIHVPGDWWNTGYFEAKLRGNEFLKRYSFNFEGNGFRYLLQELMIMIRDVRTECTRLFYEESEALADVMKIINSQSDG